MARVGHDDREKTEKIYLQVTGKMRADAAKKRKKHLVSMLVF